MSQLLLHGCPLCQLHVRHEMAILRRFYFFYLIAPSLLCIESFLPLHFCQPGLGFSDTLPLKSQLGDFAGPPETKLSSDIFLAIQDRQPVIKMIVVREERI